MNKPISVERTVGLRLKSKPPHQPMKVEEEVIPKATLAEMVRQSLRPILTMEELNQRGREFTTVNGFATTFVKPKV